MVRHDVSFSYVVFADKNELTTEDQFLLSKASEAAAKAYAPYSDFKVGVAIRTQDQQLVTGSNQENGSFPVGQCAERVALYLLTHELGRIPIETIAIVVDNMAQLLPASPCGSCRQMLMEYRQHQDAPIRLLLSSVRGPEIYEIKDVNDLLPFAFDGSFLGQ